MSRREDEKWMLRCLALAEKGAGNVSPNPLVGAVIVLKGRMLGQGYHRKFGESHAEIDAIKNAHARRSDIRGTTLYVNLEPCAHHGKTPPCAKTIVDQGIVKVVAGMKDPNPLVAGKGFAYLRNAGVTVVAGVMKRRAERLNEKFIKYITTGVPFVALKAAQTSDGFIAKKDGTSKWISSKKSRTVAHQLRSEYDAVLVGAGTAVMDNPRLTVRNVKGRNPFRVLIDGNLRTPLDSALFSDKYRKRTIVFCGNAKSKKGRTLQKKGVQVIAVKKRNGVISIPEVLSVLASKGIASLLVEGGRSIYRQFLETKSADKIYLFISPKKFGEGLSAFGGARALFRIKQKQIENTGGDLFIEGRVLYRKEK
jgi:diaminohydroxyphosphoribosylaminopyrimidine deaminase / 5-amino-6-(5-phosphoribosylamino)uracil reductase